MAKSKLDQFKTSSGRSRGCAFCDTLDTSAVVAVALRQFQEGSRSGPSKMLSSRQVSLCENCAADLWPKVRAMLP